MSAAVGYAHGVRGPNAGSVAVGLVVTEDRSPEPAVEEASLTAAGLTADDALHIDRVLFAYLYGHVLTELQEIIERPEETDHVLRLGLHRLSITDFPHLRALATALASYDGAAELDRGLDLILPGLASALLH